MKRATITLSPEIDKALSAYIRDQDAAPALTAVVHSALRQYLSERGYLKGGRKFRPLRITPARRGSGEREVSVNHDRYFGDE